MDGTTCFQAIIAPQGAFGSGLRADSIREGAVNTLIAVETAEDRAVPWTQPADWHFRYGNPTDGLGGLHGPYFLALSAGQTNYYIQTSITPQLFQGLIQVNDDLPRDPSWMDRVRPPGVPAAGDG
jgi:hypothetical protein